MAWFLEPKITEKPKNIDSKRHHKINQFLDRFLIDFCSVLDAKLVPCWPPFSAQDRPRGLQDPSKTPPRRLQDGPRCLQRRFGSPKTAQDASKPAPEPSGPRLFMIFDRLLVHFWWIVDWLLIDFGLMFNLISIRKNKRFNIKLLEAGNPICVSLFLFATLSVNPYVLET